MLLQINIMHASFLYIRRKFYPLRLWKLARTLYPSPSIYLSIYLSIHLSIYLCLYLSLISIYLILSLSYSLSYFLSLYLSVFLSASLCLFFSLSFLSIPLSLIPLYFLPLSVSQVVKRWWRLATTRFRTIIYFGFLWLRN